jgi:hypothetical protein
MSVHRKGRPANVAREQFWREHVHKWRESGLSMAEYCRSHGLSRDAFIYHRNKFTQKAPASQPEFALVPVPFGSIPETDLVPGVPLRLLIGERFRIEVSDDFSAPVLTKLVLTLEQMR